MFGLKKRPTAKKVVNHPYKQVAVRPSTHQKLLELADKRNSTIIDIAAELVGA